MSLEPNTLTLKIPDKLNATGNDYTTKTITLFEEAVKDITPEELATLITIYL